LLLQDKPSIGALIQFHHSTAYLNIPLPFGLAFGTATNRVDVLEAAEGVYRQMLAAVPSRDTLPFDVVALVAVQRDGEVNQSILKDLTKLFPCEDDGCLQLLDFAKAVDSCYKDVRLLRANIKNSYQVCYLL
jgi:hypothetical protein